MAVSYSLKDKLHPGQQHIWDNFILDDSMSRAVIVTGRQTGKTTLAKLAALHWVITDPGCEIGYLAPESKHYLKVFIWMQNRLSDIISKCDSQKNVIYFKNGSIVYFYSVENYDAIRGATFTHRIMDEFGYGRFGQPEAVNAYDATFVAKGKKDLVLSTPKGKNQLYHWYQHALTRDDEFTYRMKTEDNPMVEASYLAKRKGELPEMSYRQEYEGQFLESGGEVFRDLDQVCTLTSYSEPQPGATYYAGIDWGAKNDKSVLTIIEKSGEVAFIEYSYKTDYPSIIADFVTILRKYKIATGLAETNGVGQASFDYLAKEIPAMKPFVMTNKSKGEIVQLTRSKIEHKLIKLPSRELEPELFNELSDYEVTVSSSGLYRYSHSPSSHDDFVDSLMFAVKAAHIPFSPSLTNKTRTQHFRPGYR